MAKGPKRNMTSRKQQGKMVDVEVEIGGVVRHRQRQVGPPRAFGTPRPVDPTPPTQPAGRRRRMAAAASSATGRE